MEDWREVDEFRGYSVSSCGRVRNDQTGYILSLLVNQRGIVNVSFNARGIQYKRSVSLLVARAFLPVHPLDSFDTPINLDGDRRNNHISNLMWRPRWFAVDYFKQFQDWRRGFLVPIEETTTGERFENSWHAATKYGLLDKEIYIATLNRTYVWPTYQRFRVLETDTN